MFYIMGGNKVAPPTSKQVARTGGAGKVYTGGNTASNGPTSGGYGQAGVTAKKSNGATGNAGGPTKAQM